MELDSSPTDKDALPLFSDGDRPNAPTAFSPRTPATPDGDRIGGETAPDPVEPAPAPKPRTKPAAAAPERGAKKFSIEGIAPGGFGRHLRDLRVRNGVTIAELAETTKIRSTYIEYLEDEDYESLPPAVYVLAYVKTLCAFYGLPESAVENMTAEIRHRLAYEAPDDPGRTIIDVEEGEENHIKLRRILLIGGAGVLVVTGLIVWLILALIPAKPAATAVTPTAAATAAPTATATATGFKPLTEAQLLELQRKPELTGGELPISTK
jgi:transcriptional regulator with XRE-family HTH domain